MSYKSDNDRATFNNHKKPYARSIFSFIASEYEACLYKRSDSLLFRSIDPAS